MSQPIKNEYSMYLGVFLLFLAIITCGHFLAISLWELITFPFANPHNAVGKLTVAGFNPLNNYVRWGIFVAMPSFLFTILYLIPKVRSLIGNVFDDLLAKFEVYETEKYPINGTFYTVTTLVLLVVVPIIVFTQQNFSTANFDVFHEGVELTPAFNFISGKGVWNGTLFVRGAFNDLFTAVIGWQLFGPISIGSYRVAVLLAKLLIPFSISALLYTVWRSFKNKLTATMLIQGMLAFYLFSARIQNFDRRDAPLLFGLALLLLANTTQRNALFFTSGLFSALCAFYSLDIGIYFTILLLAFPLLSLALIDRQQKQWRHQTVVLITGVGFGWLLFYLLVGTSEFNAFLANFMFILRAKDLLDSYVYPFPNLVTNFRFTWPLIIGAINLLVYMIFFFFLYRKNNLKKEGVAHGLITMLALVHYRSALGRSDITHVEYSTSLLLMVFGMNIVLIATFLRTSKRLLKAFAICCAALNCFIIIYPAVSSFNPKNLFTFKQRLNSFVNLDDTEFLNENRRDGVKRLQQIFSTERCVFSLTSDAFTPYMLKKPTCGPFYISYFASIDPERDMLLNNLVTPKPNYILYSSESWTQNLDRINNNQRLPQLMEFVDENYAFYEKVSDYWVVYKRR